MYINHTLSATQKLILIIRYDVLNLDFLNFLNLKHFATDYYTESLFSKYFQIYLHSIEHHQ